MINALARDRDDVPFNIQSFELESDKQVKLRRPDRNVTVLDYQVRNEQPNKQLKVQKKDA